MVPLIVAAASVHKVRIYHILKFKELEKRCVVCKTKDRYLDPTTNELSLFCGGTCKSKGTGSYYQS